MSTYYGLRDYQLPPSIWDARQDCRHRFNDDQTCRCGAWRGCLGLESTPDLFIAHLVELFSEVRRVLRRDGTCWINLGDSYSGSGKGPSESLNKNHPHSEGIKSGEIADCWSLKSKDLMMMPARMAIALQEDGWYLRSEITWCKSSAMPESVRDRPTSATERIYLLSKADRYFYDADAVRQPQTGNTHGRGNRAAIAPKITTAGEGIKNNGSFLGAMVNDAPVDGMANLRNFWPLPNPRPMLRLREDLTPEQRAYVLRRLADGIGPADHA